jgi:hypothetical protein
VNYDDTETDECPLDFDCGYACDRDVTRTSSERSPFSSPEPVTGSRSDYSSARMLEYTAHNTRSTLVERAQHRSIERHTIPGVASSTPDAYVPRQREEMEVTVVQPQGRSVSLRTQHRTDGGLA